MKNNHTVHQSVPSFNAPVLKKLFETAVAAGWRWRRSKHVVLYPPDGSSPLILSVTAYDGPFNQKLVSLARRKGLDV